MAYKKSPMICEYCKQPYLGYPGRKFCSNDCSHNSRHCRKTLICKCCDKNFIVQEHSPAQFCSMTCKVEYQSDIITIRACDNCGIEVSRKEYKFKGLHSFCSKRCSEEFARGPNHYEWKEHLHDKNLKTALKQWADTVKKRDNYKCVECGEDNKSLLQAHHIESRCGNPELQFEYSNGITLCLKCHRDKHINEPSVLRLMDNNIKLLYNA